MDSFLEWNLQAMVIVFKQQIDALDKKTEELMFADDSSLGHTFRNIYTI